MSKRILFVNQRPTNKRMYVNSLPPLGILGMVSYLRSKNIGAYAVDCNIQDLDQRLVEEYDVIAFSIGIANLVNSLRTAEEIKLKYPGKEIIVGGNYINQEPRYFLDKPYIDALLIGDAEQTVYEYLTKEDKTKVRGLYFRKNGETIFTGTAPKVTNLDGLPFPALDIVDLKKYNTPIKKSSPISSIITSRGCPHECIFCYHLRQWIVRSPENVVDEIEWQVEELGVKELCIVDDNFTMDMKRAEKISDLIIERGIEINLQLWGGVRVDRLNRPLLEKLKRAGTWLVCIAPETGNKETMVKIKKGFELKQVERVVKWCKELDLATHSFFMIGFPWENRKHIKKTIKFAEKLDTDFTQFTRVYPSKGTELYEMVKDKYEIKRQDEGFFYGGPHLRIEGMSEREVELLIKRGYRNFYLKPKKIATLLRMLSMRDLFELFKYSILTRSIV